MCIRDSEKLGIPRVTARAAIALVSALLRANSALLFGAAKAQMERQASVAGA